jgi:hypothetical protein
MVLAQGDQAGQHVGTYQQWTLKPRRPPQGQMVASPTSRDPTIEEVLLRVQAGMECGVEDRFQRCGVLSAGR